MNTQNPHILYEDNHIIGVYKPAGMPTQNDESGDLSLFDWTKDYIKKAYKKPGNVFLGLVHRLDRPVAGVVLFGKTSKGASRLSEQFRNRNIQKIYHALTYGYWKEDRGTLIHFISKDEKAKKAKISEYEIINSVQAELSYTVEARGNGLSLLKIILGTGRFHQIRAQLAYADHPVVGDIKYGAPKALEDKSIALCATSIVFTHPTEDKKITVSVGVPPVWKELLR